MFMMRHTETIGQVLAQAKDLLSVVTDQAMLEAEVLLAHVLERPRSYLHAWSELPLTQQTSQSICRLFIAHVVTKNQLPI